MLHSFRKALCLLLAALCAGSLSAQRLEVHGAPAIATPSTADSNSPVYWRDGVMHMFNSTGIPRLGRGQDLASLQDRGPVQVDSQTHFPMWIESVWQDAEGTLYGWYHYERHGICEGSSLAAPEIGAAVSQDGGASFRDLGIVLNSGDAIDCSAQNGFFAGGHGDFSVVLDRNQEYFYFYFGNYGGNVSGQGVAAARMAFADVQQPVGTVWKYFEGEWREPGLGGKVTPVFPAAASWQSAETDAFWGPALHWNTHLETWVALLNHACCEPGWPQEGIYYSLNADPGNPAGWTKPAPLWPKEGAERGYDPGYYPQVVGFDEGGTDTIAGRTARLFVFGKSEWEIRFYKDGEPPEEPNPDVQPVEPGTIRSAALRSGRGGRL